MPQERLPKQALLARENTRRPVGRPRNKWTYYIANFEWNRMGLYPSKMMDVMEDREMSQLNVELLTRNPHGKLGNKERIKVFCFLYFFAQARLRGTGTSYKWQDRNNGKGIKFLFVRQK